jgi:predicted RND superfamily exporter protein
VANYAHTVSRHLLSHTKLALALSIAVGAVFAFFATRLEFDTRFSALLSEDTPELVEVQALQKLAGGTQELVLAVAGEDKAQRLAFARAVADRLDGKRWIQSAVVDYPIDFFLDRRLWFLSTDKLKELKTTLDDEIELAKARANPLFVDLEDEEDREDPWAEVDRIGESDKRLKLKRRYGTPDDGYLFVRVKPNGSSFDIGASKELLARIKAEVAAVQPAQYGVTLRYAGTLELNQEQHKRMSEDLSRAAVIALVLILFLMTLYVRRITAPLVLAVPLVTGVVTTLGVTQVLIGQLNLVSGFLVSALFGLGIDFEIHLYLRYLEELGTAERRRDAMRVAISRTLPGCVTAATTTSLAFFAMAVSDFRGFRQYGLIAGIGVLITLAITYLMLPPLALAFSRKPRAPRRPLWDRRMPRRLAPLLVGLGTTALLASVFYAQRTRWRTDFKELRGTSETVAFSYRVGDLLGGTLQPAGIYVSNLSEARAVERYLDELMEGDALVKQYVSLASMVPQDVEAKQPIIDEMREDLSDVLQKDRLKPADREKVEEALAWTRTKPWKVEDVPAVFRKRFETSTGEGQFVVIWPKIPTHIDKNIIRWGNQLRQIRVDLRARGIPARILDEHRVSARVLEDMRHDAPLVLTAAGLAVFLILLADFRSLRQSLLIVGSLAVGLSWMIGIMGASGLDLNVFNQAVLATVVGVGIDNVVHIKHRYLQEGPGSIAKVVATTGSAALLASTTTAIGFGAAITAHHSGIQSFGALALVGFSCTFVSSTVFFPAVLAVLERWRIRRERRLAKSARET